MMLLLLKLRDLRLYIFRGHLATIWMTIVDPSNPIDAQRRALLGKTRRM